MRILDRYILKAFVGPFLFGIFAFTSIFIGTGTLFKIAQYITQYGASIWAVTRAFFLAMPSIVVLTFPMAVLLASLMAFSKLSATSEITVMRAGGQSFLRLATPVYVLALVISLCTVAFNEYVVPATNHAYQSIIRNEIMKEATPRTQNHIVLKTMDGDNISTLMYAREYNADTKQLKGITVQQFSNGNVSQMENAQTAKWTGQYWIMYNGTIYDLSTKGAGIERTMIFTEQVLPIKRNPDQLSRDQMKPEEMTIKQLREQIKAYKSSYVDTSELEMELYQRFSIPLASFVFALIGAPLGLQKTRSSSSSVGFGVSVLIIFIYYGVMTFTAALGKGDVLPPVVAAFIPDGIGVLAGLFLNWRASK